MRAWEDETVVSLVRGLMADGKSPTAPLIDRMLEVGCNPRDLTERQMKLALYPERNPDGMWLTLTFAKMIVEDDFRKVATAWL